MEYAVLAAALAIIALACGALWELLEQGILVEHALMAASHHIQASIGWAADVFSF